MDFDTIRVTREETVVFVSSFRFFNSRSVKIVQRSVKSQGTLKFLMSGNPVHSVSLHSCSAQYITTDQALSLCLSFRRRRKKDS